MLLGVKRSLVRIQSPRVLIRQGLTTVLAAWNESEKRCQRHSSVSFEGVSTHSAHFAGRPCTLTNDPSFEPLLVHSRPSPCCRTPSSLSRPSDRVALPTSLVVYRRRHGSAQRTCGTCAESRGRLALQRKVVDFGRAMPVFEAENRGRASREALIRATLRCSVSWLRRC